LTPTSPEELPEPPKSSHQTCRFAGIAIFVINQQQDEAQGSFSASYQQGTA
jgi:hypothetical protein